MIARPDPREVGSWTNFQSFISGLGYGGYLVVGGAVAVFLGGIFEIAS